MPAARRTMSTESKPAEIRSVRLNLAVRYLIAGVVLLVVAVSSLMGMVTDWSQVTTSGFVGSHYLQMVVAALGCVFVVGGIVVGGIVKIRRQR